ncbi:DsbA family oxidoreductase [Vibrio genomosp. F10]|uniref:Disulfide bond formation protein DsbA n=1 Tax=Vibrio genomosp. F10 str. ZF-129 TaxID=1187848 RepID=A0A1E5BIY9_9VIBR|nr:DsbA family oxidoreductase [Vibrio genomosp. F10]OEE37470.1 disulfide bond formation protein DsbA [Vibrio genomosp. F10 str. ZF-129]OEE93043.1 disulfide bond formation protein DsbA [Vibrio genomosp. F10 str. 9ZC157]OEE93380.1 disulfide bond formation protein DsbA [Vibrio genomosp. F10 str. 9ZD137]OEF07495.1 disulfide bond formation protein DsbA [Vibrio genomosp. F10 str. 9ZB36]
MALRVDIVSDVVCPWCVIGYLRLERVLDRLALSDHLEIHWHPFELNPAMPSEGMDLYQYTFEKYAITSDASESARQSIYQLGLELNFTFNFSQDMKIYNTRKAHQLLMWSAQFGLQYSLKMALFNAYFTQQLDINCAETLCNIARSVGLNADVAQQVINDDSWKQAVAVTEQQWFEAGINAVPTFIINQKQILVGAQTEATLTDVIKNAQL